MRDRDIDRDNSRLLSNVNRIEKDFESLKKTIESTKAGTKQDFGMRPEHLSNTVQTNMMRQTYHTTLNRKKDF